MNKYLLWRLVAAAPTPYHTLPKADIILYVQGIDRQRSCSVSFLKKRGGITKRLSVATTLSFTKRWIDWGLLIARSFVRTSTTVQYHDHQTVRYMLGRLIMCPWEKIDRVLDPVVKPTRYTLYYRDLFHES